MARPKNIIKKVHPEVLGWLTEFAKHNLRKDTEIVRATGVPKSTVSQLTRGVYGPSNKTREAFQAALKRLREEPKRFLEELKADLQIK